MYLEPFFEHFPDVAEAETRTLFLRDGHGQGAPDDDYTFVESYCTDPSCDCRRVLFNVIGRRQGPVAVISYGFDPDGPMPGPFLDPINPQSDFAEDLLEFARNLVLRDPAYLARLERHYQMMKQKFAQPAAEEKWWKRKRKKARRRPPLP